MLIVIITKGYRYLQLQERFLLKLYPLASSERSQKLSSQNHNAVFVLVEAHPTLFSLFVRFRKNAGREQNRDLYLVFIDLTKAFDSVSRDALWQILRKFGFSVKLVNIIRSFHDGMMVRVVDTHGVSDAFPVQNGTKQGCVLAPILFNLFYAAMMTDALNDNEAGVKLTYRLDGGIFNLRRLQAKTKVKDVLSSDFLYADDCCLVAHTLADAQHVTDRFARSASRFGLSINVKKTEVMIQSASVNGSHSDTVYIDNSPLSTVNNFCYLGSSLSNDATIDHEISQRISKASASFGRLTHRLWSDRGIRLSTKVKVYQAVVISTLLYGCETWTLYKKHLKQLDQFHMRCLRNIAHIKWQSKTPNTEMLSRCKISGIEAIIKLRQLRWAGHVVRMDDMRLPKIVFYSQLESGDRKLGRPLLRYRDSLKANLRECNIPPEQWEAAAKDRPAWRRACVEGVQEFEQNRIGTLQEKRQLRKNRLINGGQKQQTAATSNVHICETCGRRCLSRIGLISHSRTHRR